MSHITQQRTKSTAQYNFHLQRCFTGLC